MQPRLSKWVKCLKTTSLQLATDAGDHAVERLSPTSSTRPHSSTVTSELLPPLSCITRSLCKVDGQGYSACVFQRSREASSQTTTTLLSSHLFEEFTGSSVFSTRHTNQQILTLPAPLSLLSVGLAEQTARRQQHNLSSRHDPHTTPRPLSAHTVLLSLRGGAWTLQSTPCGSSSGVTRSHSLAEQNSTYQCQANTCWKLGVSDFWFCMSEENRLRHIKMQSPVEAGNASTCAVC